MQALFEVVVNLALTIFVIIAVGGFLFLIAPPETKRWLTEKSLPEDRQP